MLLDEVDELDDELDGIRMPTDGVDIDTMEAGEAVDVNERVRLEVDVDIDEVRLDDVETASTPVEDDDVDGSELVVEGSVKGFWLLEVVDATAADVEELALSVVDDALVETSVEVDVASTAAALVVVVVEWNCCSLGTVVQVKSSNKHRISCSQT